MKTKILIGVFLLSVIVISLKFYFRQETRNHIFFDNSSTLEIQNSLKELETILNKFPPSNYGLQNYYITSDDELFINSQKIGRIDQLEGINILQLNKLSEYEKNKFLILIKNLQINNIQSATYDKKVKFWTFGYRELNSESFTQVRRIIPTDQIGFVMKSVFESFEILDTSNQLYLVKLRESNADSLLRIHLLKK